MFLSVGILSLVLYCAQQLGIALAIGSQTILLVTYLLSMRDGIIDAKESQIARAVQNTLFTSLVLIIGSGIAITLLHIGQGQAATVFEPGYLFKWALLLFALVLGAGWYALPQALIDGFAGGTWYAIFLVHILAPDTGWIGLLELYAVWMVGFMLCWQGLVYSMRPHEEGEINIPVRPVLAHPALAQPTVAQTPVIKTTPPAPVAPPPPKIPTPAPTPMPIPQKPAVPPPPPAPIPASVAPAKPVAMSGSSPFAPAGLAHLTFPQGNEPMPAVRQPAQQPVQPSPKPPVAQALAPMSLENKFVAATNPSLLAGLHVMPKSPQDLNNKQPKIDL